MEVLSNCGQNGRDAEKVDEGDAIGRVESENGSDQLWAFEIEDSTHRANQSDCANRFLMCSFGGIRMPREMPTLFAKWGSDLRSEARRHDFSVALSVPIL